MSKKYDCRFSLRMNQKDYVQAEATRILNSKGHCISEFVARAVVAYAEDKLYSESRKQRRRDAKSAGEAGQYFSNNYVGKLCKNQRQHGVYA